jgi:beta-glucosidase/6-phospho-beta-glucosidase/beta-galactosidase
MRGLWVSLALVACACGPGAFPNDFRFGASIAGFQVDPGCPTLAPEKCEDRKSDWYQWVNAKSDLSDLSSMISFEPVSNGPGFWELYETDFDLAKKELGLNAIRMSIEWSRIFPNATDGLEGDALAAAADPDAVATYHAMFQALKKRGLKPLVTLHHYTLPIWIHDGVACHKDSVHCVNRGWLEPERVKKEMAKYAAFVAKEFGGEVDDWATLNEPFAVVLPGFLFPSADRVNPPGLSFHYDDAKKAMVGMIEAHALVYDAVKANDLKDADGDGVKANVGLVYALPAARGEDPNSKADQRAADGVFYLYNTAFLDAVINGVVDADLDGKPDSAEPRADLKGRMDYLGVNYYSRIVVKGTASPSFPTLSPLTYFDPTTIVPFTDEPQGLYDVLMWAKGRYPKLPMIITETGANDPADDGTGVSWFIRYLTETKRAIKDGADVRGFFVWSLFDNYEWNHGMTYKMGIYAVSPDVSKARSPRQIAKAYADVTKAKDVPESWAKKYPVP